MAPVRIAARLDIKAPNVIKGVQLEGLRVVGQPAALAKQYYEQGIDEILFMDVVASLYQRNTIFPIVNEVAKAIFVPLTVGGGIRSLDDIATALEHGADKVAINTMAIKRPQLLSEAARLYGRQCVVLSVEAKRCGPGRWEVLTDNGREKTGLNVLDWISQAQDLGVGEILLTSVDQEGMQQGMDLELLQAVSAIVDVPLLACGGIGDVSHASHALQAANIDALSFASLLHLGKADVASIKQHLQAQGLEVRL